MTTKELEKSLDFIHKCRRSHERFPFKSGVSVISADGNIKGETVNVSLGGIYLIFPGNATPGDILDIELQIPGVTNCRVKGEVRWFLPHRENTTGCGVRFLDLNSELLNALINITSNKDLRDL